MDRPGLIKQALEEYEKNSCVKFVEIDDAFYEANIRNQAGKAAIGVTFDGSGCSAWAGKVGQNEEGNLQVLLENFKLPEAAKFLAILGLSALYNIHIQHNIYNTFLGLNNGALILENFRYLVHFSKNLK